MDYSKGVVVNGENITSYVFLHKLIHNITYTKAYKINIGFD